VSGPTQPIAARLAQAAGGYPGATEDFPWGERVAKVDQKVFLFLSLDESLEPSVSLKLPYSAHYALSLACSQPTSHGLGKSGWVTIQLEHQACPDVEFLLDWLDESYRARAGRRRITALDSAPIRRAVAE
jgi:predicted DNA-binding protein (MmcQ/YjbR family)